MPPTTGSIKQSNTPCFRKYQTKCFRVNKQPNRTEPIGLQLERGRRRREKEEEEKGEKGEGEGGRRSPYRGAVGGFFASCSVFITAPCGLHWQLPDQMHQITTPDLTLENSAVTLVRIRGREKRRRGTGRQERRRKRRRKRRRTLMVRFSSVVYSLGNLV